MVGQVFAYCLSLLLLLTHVGIPVYTHECHSMGKAWSSFFIPAKSCCNGKKGNASSQICHHNTDHQTAFKKLPCCENHHGLIQLHSDFFHHKPVVTELDFHVLGSAVLYNPVELIAFSFSLPTLRTHGPVLTLYGRSLLIRKQVFLC